MKRLGFAGKDWCTQWFSATATFRHRTFRPGPPTVFVWLEPCSSPCLAGLRSGIRGSPSASRGPTRRRRSGRCLTTSSTWICLPSTATARSWRTSGRRYATASAGRPTVNPDTAHHTTWYTTQYVNGHSKKNRQDQNNLPLRYRWKFVYRVISGSESQCKSLRSIGSARFELAPRQCSRRSSAALLLRLITKPLFAL